MASCCQIKSLSRTPILAIVVCHSLSVSRPFFLCLPPLSKDKLVADGLKQLLQSVNSPLRST